MKREPLTKKTTKKTKAPEHVYRVTLRDEKPLVAKYLVKQRRVRYGRVFVFGERVFDDECPADVMRLVMNGGKISIGEQHVRPSAKAAVQKWRAEAKSAAKHEERNHRLVMRTLGRQMRWADAWLAKNKKGAK